MNLGSLSGVQGGVPLWIKHLGGKEALDFLCKARLAQNKEEKWTDRIKSREVRSWARNQ